MKQKKTTAFFTIIFLTCCFVSAQPPKVVSTKIPVDASNPGTKIPSSIYGIFSEEIKSRTSIVILHPQLKWNLNPNYLTVLRIKNNRENNFKQNFITHNS